MLACVAVIVLIGMSRPAADLPAHSSLPSPSGPLRKPEPQSLLVLGNLKLTPAQSRSIQAIAAKWAEEKSNLLSEMARFAPRDGRIQDLQSTMGGYSEVSRTFDATRQQYWQQACAALTVAQKTRADEEAR
ncbi:MAG: hypothetical protein P4L46_15535 [Fimbriimonas sp.]|nr:hypothetical protein [Fimbriimonas sp.]